jgi:hypothetical protein
MATTKVAKVEPVDMKLEVIVLGVADVDRAKAFYRRPADVRSGHGACAH